MPAHAGIAAHDAAHDDDDTDKEAHAAHTHFEGLPATANSAAKPGRAHLNSLER
jgi:hypothetical protein